MEVQFFENYLVPHYWTLKTTILLKIQVNNRFFLFNFIDNHFWKKGSHF